MFVGRLAMVGFVSAVLGEVSPVISCSPISPQATVGSCVRSEAAGVITVIIMVCGINVMIIIISILYDIIMTAVQRHLMDCNFLARLPNLLSEPSLLAGHGWAHPKP